MSSNPYAQPESYDPGFSGYEEPPRVSGLAVTSLVLSLICCIPGVSLLGAILGGVAIVRISQSGGRRSGKGLAIAGLILGILITMLWVGLAVGMARALGEFTTFGDTIRALEQRDYNRVRQALSPAAATAATDQRLEEFRVEVQAEWGEFRRLPQGIAGWIEAYLEATEFVAQRQQQPPFGDNLFPIPMHFDNGVTFVIFVLDPAAGTGPQGAALSSNLGVLDQQAQPMWLHPPGTPGVPVPRLPTQPAAPGAPPTAPPEPAEPAEPGSAPPEPTEPGGS